jgi:phytoene/squalene synthetase
MPKSIRTNIDVWEKKKFGQFLKERYPSFYLGDYSGGSTKRCLCYGYSTIRSADDVEQLTASLLKYQTIDEEYKQWKSRQTSYTNTAS